MVGFGYILKAELTGFAAVWTWGMRKEGVKEGTIIICQSNERARVAMNKMERITGGQAWGGADWSLFLDMLNKRCPLDIQTGL